MSLAAGGRLGPYEITAKLGTGGMGEVWRATDSRLKRDVAIKVLPAEFTADPERLARFEREAQLLAQLHHPNIASIFGLEESGGTRALVMELVEGPTLAERLEQRALPFDDVLSMARQIAEALEAAHEKGIVHRDLKPQNVKLAADGTVKVLDFGLAKAMEPPGAVSGSAAQLAQSPTLTLGATQMGVILGTAAYMAPEQAKGFAVDKRADIWAFGVVLYEMLTGARLFDAPTVPETLAQVLTRTPDLDALPQSTPPALRRLLRRCLARSPRHRLHDIADARLVIEDLIAGGEDVPPSTAIAPASAAPRSVWRPLGLGLIAGIALGAISTFWLARSPYAPPPAQPPMVHALTYSGRSYDPSLSPDGKYLAFVSDRDGEERIWLKQLASGEEIALAERGGNPRISPDSGTLLFEREGEILRVPLLGGTARRIARGRGGIWSPDGREIAFVRTSESRAQIFRTSADGGAEQALTEDPDFIGNVAWSPDGARLAFTRSGRVNAIGSRSLRVLELATGEVRELLRLPAGSAAVDGLVWDGNADLLYVWSPTQAGRRAMLLRRLPLSGGEPTTLYSFSSSPGRIELAGPGALIFDFAEIRQSLYEVVAGDPLRRSLTGGPTIDRQPAFSPDGQRIVFSSDRSGGVDLWALDLATGGVRRLTFDAADDWDPHWSPDGRHLLWSSNRSGHYEIWIADIDGSGARQVTADGVDAENPSMSADGEWVVYSSGNPAHRGIWKVRPDGSEATLLLGGNFVLPELSPKTGWVAAAESPGGVVGGAPSTVIRIVRLEDGETVASTEVPGQGANFGRSRWLPDGRTLVAWGAGPESRALYRLPIEPGRDLRAGRELIVTGTVDQEIESHGIAPVDDRVVVSVRSGESDIARVEGIPGIGASLPRRER
jgi:serine/threonine protein kinase/Tol biopolymer transport system component